MVKKTYINPEIIVVRLMPTTVLAASPLNVANSGDTTELNQTSAPDGADALVKGSKNIWDEEW